MNKRELFTDDFHEDCMFCENGEHYVYIWEEENGKVFYVGSGEGHRYRDVSARSDRFKQHLIEHRCQPKIVAFGLSKDEARAFESDLIDAYRQLDFPLQNAIKIGCMPIMPE